jgi:hypothetical protein
MTEDKLERAKQQGQAQYESIRELVVNLRDERDSDRSREAICENALSVEVRSGWYVLGRDMGTAEEFQILLCWGGPAVRLIGTLNQHGEPESVTMQVQDWFQPWTDFSPAMGDDDNDALLAYARCFYFGN